MKKFYFTVFAFCFFFIANAQIVNIPDANFKAELLAANPTNTIATAAATSTDLVYRYACQNGTTASVGAGKPAYIFEIDAVLESNAYTSEDNKMSKDGGDNVSFYESGNSLNLLPTTSNF